MAKSFTNYNPRIIEQDNVAIVQSSSQITSDPTATVLDKDWSKEAFLINDSEFGDTGDIVNRYWSTASAKFTDTRMGCNIGVNSRPQFTRYADVRVQGRLAGRKKVTVGETSGNFGMGRYYSEAIDDPGQVVYLRFGVPQFNSLTNFISKAFSGDLTTLARTGRTSAFFTLGKLVGSIAAMVAFPAIAVIAIGYKVVNHYFGRATSKFYTLKPTMHLYWSVVNQLVNTLAINRGILPKMLNDDPAQRIGRPYKIDEDTLSAMARLLPDMFVEDAVGFRFDVYAIANKAQRLANQQFHTDYTDLNNGTSTDFTGYVKKDITSNGSHPTHISDDKNKPTLGARLNDLLQFGYYTTTDKDSKTEINPKIDINNPKGAEKKDTSWFQDFLTHTDSEFRDGAAFASFRVDHTGSVSESFANATVESDLSSKLNGISSQIREARFTFAEGNLVGGVGGMIQDVVGAAKDVVMGAASGLTFGFSDLLAGLAGSGFVDIPKHWQSSTANLPRSSYTIQLISPYNNPISHVQNIYIPLCMLLAGALPMGTGKASYTSPFICQLYDRGRCQIQLGMIESLSITRGTSNLPFDIEGKALALDVTFTVADLSSIMHMPISAGDLFGYDTTLDEDNILSDYLAVLAGQDIYSQIYALPKAKLRLAKDIANAAKLTSSAYWASVVHDSMPFKNVLEGLNRGTNVTVVTNG